MLSGKLIRLIESHEEQITTGIVRSIRHHPELPHLGTLSELELRERCREILENLGHWLAHGNEEKLAGGYEAVGKLRFAQCMPLEECVRGLCLIKDKTIDFVDAQGIDPDSLALYAEGQFVRRIGPFFDLLVIHLVRGYETARRLAAHAAA
jgi:hypothetical protein